MHTEGHSSLTQRKSWQKLFPSIRYNVIYRQEWFPFFFTVISQETFSLRFYHVVVSIYKHSITYMYMSQETFGTKKIIPRNENSDKTKSRKDLRKWQELLGQGLKLCPIQAPMRLNFSLWRPNPEN